MAEFPAMPLWTDAYLADTRHLTTHQHGAYLLLLMSAWRSPDCNLPNDDKMLARMAGMNVGMWRQCRDTIMEFWTLGDDGKWYQKRLSKVRSDVTKKTQAKALSGKIGGLSKSLKNNNRHVANATIRQPFATSETVATKTKTKKKESSNGLIPLPQVREDNDSSVPKQRPQAMASDGPTPAGLCDEETKEQAVTKRLTIPDDVRNALPKRPGA